ncbi:unnamed protein product [Chironomus riparius]|uniref:UDP-glucuronosyltransferase n=1 Tax=Chironomus riparius TaxID=315576 RepID=A0A9N9S714_9DIPT|nr:unnamed protein product [Chironomus riparius]
MKWLIALSALIFAVNLTLSLQILAVLPLSMKSHLAIGNSIVNSLLEAGHNVTAISNLIPDKPSDNYRVVQIPDVMKEFQDQEPNPFEYIDFPIFFSVIMMPPFGADMVKLVMKSENLDAFLKTDEKFDVCIMELFGNEALMGIPEKFNCALIFYNTYDALFWSDTISGNTSPASYVPNPFLWFTDNMSFKQRLVNTVVGLLETTVHYVLHLPWQRYLYNSYFPNAKRSFNDMYKNSSITFINNHVSSSFVRPHMPTQIEIGGIHVKPAKPLASDLQKYMDDATDGVILFSMGSYIDGTDWKEEHREMFIKVFGKLKQKIIWRYSNETLPDNPGNIKIGHWFPQRDILAHPNLKVFITHGGLLGTTEAIVEGVPVLGIPVFGDQMMNLMKTVARGYGLQVLYPDLSEETFGNALKELLRNRVYKDKAKKISKIFNDRPRTPQQEVVYWTEYVARHNGAAHLQAESVNFNYIQLFSFDVYIILAIISLIVLYIEFKILKIILRKIFKKSSNKKKNQ